VSLIRANEQAFEEAEKILTDEEVQKLKVRRPDSINVEAQ